MEKTHTVPKSSEYTPFEENASVEGMGETGYPTSRTTIGVEHDMPDSAPISPLRAASSLWKRRGYRESYQDDYLVQLVGRGPFGLSSLPFLLLAIVALVAAIASFILALSRRPWHTVTIVRRPDGRVISHTQWSPHPPDEE